MAVGLLITPNNNEIIAITSNTWMIPPAEYMKKPKAHPIIRITAIIYNNEFMVMLF
jgi:hypothetical protein